MYNNYSAVKTLRPYVVLQNFRGHAEDSLLNLETVWARDPKKFYQPWFGVFNAAVS